MTRLYTWLCGLIDRVSSRGDLGKKLTLAVAVAVWLAVTAWQIMKILS